MKRIVTTVVAVVLVLVGLGAGGNSAVADTTAALNCQHHQGAGAVRSADYLHLVSDYDTHIGAVQLCKDSASRFWGYMVLYNPMPAGKWGNVYIEVYWDGEYRARYSCEGSTPTSSGNKHIKAGETMCWTPKIYGTDTRWTYYVYGSTFSGAFGDTSRLHSQGHTYFTFR